MTENTIKILATMTAYSSKQKDQDADPTLWTNRILASLAQIEPQTANAAVTDLQINGYLVRHKGAYMLTDDGREYYAGLCKQPAVSESLQAWKNEVLTGMDRKGHRTSIQYAVIPGAMPREERYTEVETLLARAKTKQRLLETLNIDSREYDSRVKSGSIHICNGHDGVKHVGIFHRRNSRLNGWQYLCRECRKEMRKK